MLLHLIESSRRRSWYAAPTLWSAGAHAAVVASLVIGASGAASGVAGEEIREAIYFLPLLPERAEPPKAERLQYAGDLPGQGVSPGDGFATVPVGGGERGRSTGTEALPVVASTPTDSGEANVSPVYLEAELDQPVERDPSSAGPVYPEQLRSKNVEGDVIAEWVVDTTGRADTSSFRIVETTHTLFSESVRAVLPAMHFRPAELMGRRVRQLVRQQFRFVMTPAERHAVDSAAARPKGL
jgi:protein TonB